MKNAVRLFVLTVLCVLSVQLFAAAATSKTVTIEFNGGILWGSMDAETVTLSSTSVPLDLYDYADAALDGYVLTGWNTKDDGSGSWYHVDDLIYYADLSGSITLYAQWCEVPNDTYVLFNTCGGSFSSAASSAGKNEFNAAAASGTVIAPNVYRSGYTLIGWLDSDPGDAASYTLGYLSNFYLPGETVSTSENLTLYALWIANNAQERAVIFNTNSDAEFYAFGGTRELERGGIISCANHAHLERSGYVLTGWNTAADGSGLEFDPLAECDTLEHFPEDMAVVLYAQWEQVALPADYAVFAAQENLFSGGAYYSIMNAEAPVSVPTLNKSGYVLACWTPYADGGFDSDALLPGDTVTLSESSYYYPVWQLPTEQNWRFHANGGSFAADFALESASGVTGVTAHSETGKADEIHAYEIHTGTSAYASVLTYEAQIIDSLSKTGYTFAGWNTRRDGSGTQYAAGTIPSDLPRVHLFAQWEEIPAVELIDFAFARMILGNALDMQFAFPKAGVESGAYVEVVRTAADGSKMAQTIAFEDFKSATISGVAHYYVTYSGIAAKEMADTIVATVYDKNGVAISNGWEDSVREYALRSLRAANATAKNKTMLVDMLNYGAAAQVYFTYNADDLANKDLTAAEQALATTADACVNEVVKGAKNKGSRLILESSIKVQQAFSGLNDQMYATVEFTNYNGRKVSETIEGSAFQIASVSIIELDQIVLADARTIYTLTIYNSDGTVYDTHVDSVASYIARASDNALYDAIMNFADSAYNYLKG